LALLLITGDHRSKLERRLTGFGPEDYEPDEESEFVARGDQQLAETRLMQEMVGFTGRVAERVGLLNRVENKLEQADVPLRPPEALFFYLCGVFVVGAGAALILPLPAAAIVVLLAVLLPSMTLEFRRKRRLRKFEMQLPDVLNLMSGSMRAGFSFSQGLEQVAEEASEPARRELQRCFTESRLGRPIEDSMEESANRMHSVDLMWAVMAIRIQREVGGNLSELLLTVADTMVARERLRRDVAALTAEGKISAIVLGILPVGLGLFIYTSNPGYMDPLFDKTVGNFMLGGSILLAFFGFYWMKKTIEIDI
jgi:tight adherence protein B